MRILLDESLPRRLRGELKGHSVTTVQDAGWSGISNGELLKFAAERFDVFPTADQNFEFQQNLAALPMSVIVLAAPTNKIDDLRPLVPELLSKLSSLSAISFVRIGS